MKRKALRQLFLVLSAVFSAANLSCPTVPRPAPRPVALPTPTAAPSAATDRAPERAARVRHALKLGAQYLVGSVEPDGRFIYRINLDPSVKVKPSYNMLRHAGTMYALATYHERWPSPELADALAKSAGFLRRFMGPPAERDDTLAVWETEEREEAKLGGAGLALVALAAQESAGVGTADLPAMSRLGSFITYLQKPDGGFYSKYFTARGKSDTWTSLYYPGEAALGLLMLHELSPASGWLDAAVHALGFLAEQRRGRARVEPDHWALIATGRLFALHGHAEWPRDRGLLKTHALQICESVLSAEQVLDPSSPLYGAFDPEGRTTPAATRLEGLIAALPLLEDGVDTALEARARKAIDAGIELLLRAQVTEGDYAGALPRALSSTDPRATEVRIDYVQHAMSAWMGYLELVESAPPPGPRPR